MFLRCLLLSVMLLAVFACDGTPRDNAHVEIDFSIKRQPLIQVIRTLSAQADVEILISVPVPATLAGPVTMRSSVEEALTTTLKDTPLTFEHAGGRASSASQRDRMGIASITSPSSASC